MSERREGGGGGGLPARPPRLPGLPENAQLFSCNQFEGLNTKLTRPGIRDGELSWCDNLMPLGPYTLVSLPDAGPAIFAANRWNVDLLESATATDTIVVGTGAPFAVGSVVGANWSVSGLLGGSATVTTTAANEIIVLGIHCVTDTRAAVSIASMTDTGGLNNWTQRYRLPINYPTGGTQNSSTALLWYGKAASPLTTTINFTFSDYVYGWACTGMHVQGADFASPWDTFGPVTQTGFTPVQPTVTAQSNLPNALMFTFASAAQELADQTITGGSGGLHPVSPFLYPPDGFTWLGNSSIQNVPPLFPFNNAGSACSLTYLRSLPAIASRQVQWRYSVFGQSWDFIVDTLTGT